MSASKNLEGHFYLARKDMVGDNQVHRRFHEITAGTYLFMCRTGVKAFYIGYFDKDNDWVEFPDVPYEPYMKLLNRVWVLSGLPPNAIANKVKKLGITPFNPMKEAKLVNYTKRGTFPEVKGVVKTRDGREYEGVVIIGDCETGTKGLLYNTLSQQLMFVPEVEF